MKCIVYGCSNHSFEGKFLGYLCAPCWNCITSATPEKHRYSQAWRNLVEANRIGKIKEAFNTIECLSKSDCSNNVLWYNLVEEMTK
jgi:hypothetical protein